MAIYLIIEKGPKKGEKFKLSGGEKIGREKGDIVLNDNKVSSVHAVVKKSLVGGNFYLQDHKSKNGIIHKGQRIDKIKLIEGLSFRIGSNHFRVISEEEATKSQIVIEPEVTPPPKKVANKPKAKPEKPILDEPKQDDVPQFPSEVRELGDSLDDHSSLLEYDPDTQAPNEEPQEPTIAVIGRAEKDSDPVPEAIPEDGFEDKDDISLEESKNTQITRKLEDGDLSGLSIDQLTNDIPRKNTSSKQSISVRTLDEVRKKTIEPQPEGRKTWSEVLEKFTREQLKSLHDQPRELKALTPRVRLTFYRGPQTETEWELGFGPRVAGRSSLDLPIIEEKAPAEVNLFEISPSDEGPKFMTDCFEFVTLNGQAQTDILLKSGDIIAVLGTEIEVNLF